MIIVYTACILNYADKITVFNFVLINSMISQFCCQWSAAVMKAVAELKIERLWLQHTASLAGSHVTTV